MIVRVYNYDDETGVETPVGPCELADVIPDAAERHKALSYLIDWGRYWTSNLQLLTMGKHR